MLGLVRRLRQVRCGSCSDSSQLLQQLCSSERPRHNIDGQVGLRSGFPCPWGRLNNWTTSKWETFPNLNPIRPKQSLPNLTKPIQIPTKTWANHRRWSEWLLAGRPEWAGSSGPTVVWCGGGGPAEWSWGSVERRGWRGAHTQWQTSSRQPHPPVSCNNTTPAMWTEPQRDQSWGGEVTSV